MSIGIEYYDDKIASARALTESHAGIQALLSPEIEPELLHRFLIEYCSLGVQITAPVDGWIRRAGLRFRYRRHVFRPSTGPARPAPETRCPALRR